MLGEVTQHAQAVAVAISESVFTSFLLAAVPYKYESSALSQPLRLVHIVSDGLITCGLLRQ